MKENKSPIRAVGKFIIWVEKPSLIFAQGFGQMARLGFNSVLYSQWCSLLSDNLPYLHFIWTEYFFFHDKWAPSSSIIWFCYIFGNLDMWTKQTMAKGVTLERLETQQQQIILFRGNAKQLEFATFVPLFIPPFGRRAVTISLFFRKLILNFFFQCIISPLKRGLSYKATSDSWSVTTTLNSQN